ncbi:MAG: bacterial Ig-like domain-containing protein, partial [Vagococcus sp.]
DISSTATIIVKDMEVIKVQQVSVKDSTISTGSKWEAKDNFNHVMLTSGVNLTWKDVEKDIKVEGKVDTNVPGSYKVTYTYQDKSAVATITVANKSTDKGKTTPPKKLLPQTGESISGSMVAIGFIIVVGVFLIVASKLKKKEP